MVSAVPFPDIFAPLSYVLGSIDVLELTHSMFFVLFPLSIIIASVKVCDFAWSLSTSIFLLSEIDCSIGEY